MKEMEKGEKNRTTDSQDVFPLKTVMSSNLLLVPLLWWLSMSYAEPCSSGTGVVWPSTAETPPPRDLGGAWLLVTR